MFHGFILLFPAILKGNKRLPQAVSGKERVTSAHDFTSTHEMKPLASAAAAMGSLTFH